MPGLTLTNFDYNTSALINSVATIVVYVWIWTLDKLDIPPLYVEFKFVTGYLKMNQTQ